MEKRYTFTKGERLCSKIISDRLFTEGISVYSNPFRFVCLPVDYDNDAYPVKVIFSVPRRNFKQAVKRNLIRRRMREAYRMNKHSFYESVQKTGSGLALMIIYIQKDISPFSIIETGIRKGMGKVISKISTG